MVKLHAKFQIVDHQIEVQSMSFVLKILKNYQTVHAITTTDDKKWTFETSDPRKSSRRALNCQLSSRNYLQLSTHLKRVPKMPSKP